MNFAIYIPTRARLKQRTCDFLHEAGLGNMIHLVCSEQDAASLGGKLPFVTLVPLPNEVPRGIGHKRQWMIEHLAPKLGHRYVLMLDDDLQFYARKTEDDWHLRNATNDDLVKMVEMIRDLCTITGAPMVALSARQGNQHFKNPVEYNRRTCTAYAVDTEYFNRNGIRFDRLSLMEDFDATLQVLRNGDSIPMVARYAWGQRGSNSAGGCSLYRTPELQSECAEKLAELHPEFVTVVDKKMKTGHEQWKVRKDVRVQWKKAYESGREGAA